MSSEIKVNSDITLFVIKVDGKKVVEIKDNSGVVLARRDWDSNFNVDKLGRFLANNKCNLKGLSLVDLFKQLKGVIDVIGEEVINPGEEDFFSCDDTLPLNQLIYNQKLAYTFSNERTVVLITKDEVIDIIQDTRFKIKNIIPSMKLSPHGHKKWLSKEVNIAIFSSVKNKLKEFVHLESEIEYDIVVLWIVHTYLFNLQGSTFYLHFTGIHGTGKSSQQKFLAKLTWNAMYMSDLSNAALFRKVDATQNTLNIDEIDKWTNNHKNEIQGVLNNGYSKGGTVERVEKTGQGRFVCVTYKVFSPKSFATNYPKMLNSFKSRCIDITMIPSDKPLKNIDCLTYEEEQEFTSLRDDIIIYMLHHGKEIYDIFLNELKNNTAASTRKNQLFKTISCFMKHFGVTSDIEEYFESNKGDEDDEYDFNYILLGVLARNCNGQTCIEVTNLELCNQINLSLSDQEKEIINITPQKVGVRMKHFGFKKYKRQNKGTRHYQHFIIPTSAVRETIARFGYQIDMDLKSYNNIDNTNNIDNKMPPW